MSSVQISRVRGLNTVLAILETLGAHKGAWCKVRVRGPSVSGNTVDFNTVESSGVFLITAFSAQEGDTPVSRNYKLSGISKAGKNREMDFVFTFGDITEIEIVLSHQEHRRILFKPIARFT